MVCGECGRPYRRQIWSKYGEKKAVWRCENRLHGGIKYCKNSPTIYENSIQQTITDAINDVLNNKETFINSFRNNVLRVIVAGNKSDSPTEYDEEMESLKDQMTQLIQVNAMKGNNISEYEATYKEISERLESLEIMKISFKSGIIIEKMIG